MTSEASSRPVQISRQHRGTPPFGIGGEMAFGLAMGTIMSMVFIACQWAGEIIGQQMGLNLGEVIRSQSFGAQASLVGDLYFMLTLVTSSSPSAAIAPCSRACYASFEKFCPLLVVGHQHARCSHLLAGLLRNRDDSWPMRLAAPMLITMLVVDLVLGLIGKTVPQMNVMAAGLSLRSAGRNGRGHRRADAHHARDAANRCCNRCRTVWDGWSGQ
jgi:flagellar biosynthetic protein FliR